jgi:hypothetical protein
MRHAPSTSPHVLAPPSSHLLAPHPPPPTFLPPLPLSFFGFWFFVVITMVLYCYYIVVRYDDLFLLRYVLSYKGKTTKCVDPIKFTVDFRTQHADIIAKIHANGVDAVPHHKEAMRFNCTGMSGCLPTGEPLWVVRTGYSMQDQVSQSVSQFVARPASQSVSHLGE